MEGEAPLQNAEEKKKKKNWTNKKKFKFLRRIKE